MLATAWDRQQLLVPAVPLASEDSDLGESADFESFRSVWMLFTIVGTLSR